jgi:hypothetical protein
MLSGRRAGLLLYDLLVSITNAQDHHFAPVFDSTLSFPHRNQFIRNLSGYQVAKYDVLTFHLLVQARVPSTALGVLGLA